MCQKRIEGSNPSDSASHAKSARQGAFSWRQEVPQGNGSANGLAQPEHEAKIFKSRMDLFHLRLDLQQPLQARVVTLG